MSRTELQSAQSSMAGAERGVRAVIAWLAWAACAVAPPVLRVALAVPFFRSGLTRWDGFLSVSPSTVYMFQEVFKLHIFGGIHDLPAPIVMAHVTAFAEITLPVLLVLGLATRFTALGLLIMTGVIELIFPDAWATFHLPWAAMAIAIVALGPGVLSLDHLLERRFARGT